jgi:hypothetical protein
VENLSNDADSFVVECSESFRGEKQNRFRLYFVDAAETDANSEFKLERLKEQADYWQSDDPDFALEMGLRAEQTAKRLLRGGFSVYTQGETAPTLGTPRYYAMIQIDGRWLDESLVEDGLARIYGKGTDLPGGQSEQQHWNRLRQLERAAKSKRCNGWRGAVVEEEEKASGKTFEPYDTVTVRDTWIYSTKDGRKVTVIPTGTAVSVVGESENARVLIRFKKQGAVYEGLCAQNCLR